MDATNFNDGPDGNIYCKTCYKMLSFPGVDGDAILAKAIIETTAIPGDDSNACPSCGGRVFDAEKMVGVMNL